LWLAHTLPESSRAPVFSDQRQKVALYAANKISRPLPSWKMLLRDKLPTFLALTSSLVALYLDRTSSILSQCLQGECVPAAKLLTKKDCSEKPSIGTQDNDDLADTL
jgi:hypothetical protein